MPGTGPGMTHGSRMTANTPPPWTLAGFNLGLRLALPVLPGMMAFGLAVGATAARKGLGFADNLLMNLLVYAGMSQLVALEAWPERFTLGALAGLAALMITINARMLLMSAALYPCSGTPAATAVFSNDARSSGFGEYRIDNRGMAGGHRSAGLVRDRVVDPCGDGRGVGVGRKPLVVFLAEHSLALDIAAQQDRAGCREQFRRQCAREHRLAGAGQPADRDQPRLRGRHETAGPVEIFARLAPIPECFSRSV